VNDLSCDRGQEKDLLYSVSLVRNVLPLHPCAGIVVHVTLLVVVGGRAFLSDVSGFFAVASTAV
jgi:hypothetical protein